MSEQLEPQAEKVSEHFGVYVNNELVAPFPYKTPGTPGLMEKLDERQARNIGKIVAAALEAAGASAKVSVSREVFKEDEEKAVEHETLAEYNTASNTKEWLKD